MCFAPRKVRMEIPVYFVAIGAGVSAAVLPVLIAYWMLRPNRSRVDPTLELATWNAVADGLHNSNTDLIFWRDHFYLVHAASPFHLGSKRCRLVVRRSRDARIWETVAERKISGEDIRDPKFAKVGDRLFLYALPNRGLRATPYGTVYAISDDGVHWSAFETIDHPGWLFWRSEDIRRSQVVCRGLLAPTRQVDPADVDRRYPLVDRVGDLPRRGQRRDRY